MSNLAVNYTIRCYHLTKLSCILSVKKSYDEGLKRGLYDCLVSIGIRLKFSKIIVK